MPIKPGQRHLKFSKKDSKEAVGIKSGREAFFLHTDPGTEISVFAKSKCSFAEDIQAERGHIFSSTL